CREHAQHVFGVETAYRYVAFDEVIECASYCTALVPLVLRLLGGSVSISKRPPTRAASAANARQEEGLKLNPSIALAVSRPSRSRKEAYPIAFGQVFLIQSAAAVDSLWPLPGFGQFAGAVMLRIGMVTIRSGSQTGKGYSATFLLKPVTVSL